MRRHACWHVCTVYMLGLSRVGSVQRSINSGLAETYICTFLQCMCRILSWKLPWIPSCIGLARAIYIQCMYGILGREIIKYTVIYGAYIRFWPTLCMCRILSWKVPWILSCMACTAQQSSFLTDGLFCKLCMACT
jgi:hypothetical protein